jgi:two-component system chemotaxis response regulator CheY
MLNILIVDDSIIIRNNLKKQLEDLGHNVIALAKSAKEAIAIYSKHQPDLVTMDITMPMMSGIEALKAIKKINNDAIVIMVTSHGEENLVMDAIKNGAKGYILKPITHGKILNAIEKVLPFIESKCI